MVVIINNFFLLFPPRSLSHLMLFVCRLPPDTSPGWWKSLCPTSPNSSVKEHQEDSYIQVQTKKLMTPNFMKVLSNGFWVEEICVL